MGEMRNAYKILVEKPEGERPQRQCRWISEKQVVKGMTGFSWLRVGLMSNCCEHGDETWVFIKAGNVLTS